MVQTEKSQFCDSRKHLNPEYGNKWLFTGWPTCMHALKTKYPCVPPFLIVFQFGSKNVYRQVALL